MTGSIRTIIQSCGGTTKFRRFLEGVLGERLPRRTVEEWSSGRQSPPRWCTRLIQDRVKVERLRGLIEDRVS